MNNILIVDTETGGLDATKHSILSIAFTSFVKDNIELYLVINEGEIFATEHALSVNGLTFEQIEKEGLSPKDAITKIDQYLNNEALDVTDTKFMLGGHNIGFDVSFMRRLAQQADCPEWFDNNFSHKTIDTVSIARFLTMVGKLPVNNGSSQALFEHFHIEPAQYHNALEDARSTKLLLQKMIELVK